MSDVLKHLVANVSPSAPFDLDAIQRGHEQAVKVWVGTGKGYPFQDALLLFTAVALLAGDPERTAGQYRTLLDEEHQRRLDGVLAASEHSGASGGAQD